MSGKKIIEGLKEAVEHAHNHQPDKDAAERLAQEFLAKMTGGTLDTVYGGSACESVKDAIRYGYAAGLAAGVPEWQPIETVPLDERAFLGYNKEYGIRETRFRFYGDGSIAKNLFSDGNGPRGDFEWSEPQNNWGSNWKPTHWMPLPAAPSSHKETK